MKIGFGHCIRTLAGRGRGRGSALDRSGGIAPMRHSLAIITLTFATLVFADRARDHLDPITWWSLVEVVDEGALKLRSEKGETRTITLACVGRAKDSQAPITY